jgi:hypothetical protein
MDTLAILGYTLFALGAFVSCLNFYLSVLCYPLCKLWGREYKWVSGIPLIGSLLLVVSMALLHESPAVFWGGIIIALLDTGGLHWFIGIMLWMAIFRRDQK